MAQKTELTALALPGQVRTFVAKIEAVVSDVVSTVILLAEFDIAESLLSEFDIAESLLSEFDISVDLEGSVK